MKFWDFHTHQKEREQGIYNMFPGDVPPEGPFSLGIHPWYLEGNWEKEMDQIQQCAAHPNLFAIGECGFDLLKGPEVQLQQRAFAAQAALAHHLGLPLILHCVKGSHLLQEYLKKTNAVPPIIWHGYTLKPSLAQSLLKYPIYFSFGKALLQKDSNAHQWLKACPLDRIFLETDDSGLEISSIYKQASLILQLPLEDLCRQLKDNWNRISKRKIG